jgi:hypothetical protein
VSGFSPTNEEAVMTLTLKHTAVLALAASALIGAAPAAAGQGSPSDSPLMQFEERVNAYANLRSWFEEPILPIRGTLGQRSTVSGRRYLASAIRTARSRAEQGNVFTPGVAALFRDYLSGALTRHESLLLIGGRDEEEGAPAILTNEAVAEEWFTRMPPAVSAQLLELPEGIEYRFVRGDLILWDAHAEIVIDVLPNALGFQDR